MIKKFSFSNLLIYISGLFTLIVLFFPEFYIFGVNKIFLDRGLCHIYFLQFFIGTFLHASLLHFFTNSIFLYLFGNTLELIIGTKKMIIFFVFSTIFLGILLTLTTNNNTIGISGFAMAILSYYILELKSRNDIEYKGGITALIINIGIGIHPNISFYGHLYGAIAGVIFYFICKEFFKRKMVGIVG